MKCTLLFVLPVFCVSIKVVHPQLLKVSVYYESLCPFSIRFIVNQLYSTYQELSEYLQVDLVPHGSVNEVLTDGEWLFSCQHGAAECYGNKIQQCVLNRTEHATAREISFVHCAMNKFYGHTSALQQCADETGFEWAKLKSCAEGMEGVALFLYHGERTRSVKALITGWPHVFFDDIYNQTLKVYARQDFGWTACNLLDYIPPFCEKFLTAEYIV